MALFLFILLALGFADKNWLNTPDKIWSRSPGSNNMSFFTSAIDVLQTLVIALGGGLCVWGGINLLEGYGQDNPASNAHVR